jgi:transcriptional regulator GlxA family with amidase domain
VAEHLRRDRQVEGDDAVEGHEGDAVGSAWRDAYGQWQIRHWRRNPDARSIGAMHRIDIVIFDGFDELDALGPYEVFRNAGLDARLVTLAEAATVTASHGLALRPHGTLGRPDAVLVPGGGWMDGAAHGVRAEVERGELPARLRELAAAGTVMTSVCTGAMLLAAAGVTEGRPAVTHRGAIDDLRATGALVHEDARVVDDGDLVTAGGVTSGIDMALHLVERERGRAAADAVAREMEHRRDERVLQPQR